MIMLGIDGRDWRTCRGFVEMCGMLDEYCSENTCRLTCWMQWPGLWVAESTPAIHGILQGYELPHMSWELMDRHGGGVPGTLILYQETSDGRRHKLRSPLHCATPLKTDGVTVSQALVESLPPHVVEAVQRRVKAINARMADEVRELDTGSGHVGESEGNGEEGGVLHGHIPNLVRW